MCQRNDVTDKLKDAPQWIKNAVQPLSDTERRQEIDYRVAARLAMIEDRNHQYQRGVWDCLYFIFILAMSAYIAYTVFWAEEK
jgi:hypothetical protein